MNGGTSTYGYVNQSPLQGIDPAGLFTVYAYQLYSGEWKFRFRFHQSCIAGNSPIDHVDQGFQRFVPWLGKLRRQQVNREKPTGDVDAADKCACRAFDPELEALFAQHGWSTGDRYGGADYSETQANHILSVLMERMNQLNRNEESDCKKCQMPWDTLVQRAKARGVPFIGNGIN